MGIEFRILGPLELSADGRVLPLGSPKQRALLALLLIHANEAVSRDRLIEELWGDAAPASVESAFHSYLSRLRRLLDSAGASGVLAREAHGYRLRIEPDELDATRFEGLVREGNEALAAGKMELAADRFRRALALWRGPPLADLRSERFAIDAGARLEEERVSALEQRLEADLALAHHPQLTGELETLVAEHPYRERLRGQLMLALYRSGRQAEALRAYQDARRTFADELGLEPGPELRELEQAILRHDPGLSLEPLAQPRAESEPEAAPLSGTVTFLVTDIEGSTLPLKQLGGRYGEVLAEHRRILRSAFEAHGGREIDTQGDSFFVAFRRAKDAVAAAVAAQRDLAAHAWPEGGEVKVRMGLHTGEPRLGGERNVGSGAHKAARIGAAGHGGQVLLSRATRELVEDELPPGVDIKDLGERRLKDLDRPERLAQLVIEGLPSQFAALQTLDVELRRRRRRMYAGSAVIGVLAAAVAIPVFALGQGSGGGGANVEPNSVAVIDAESNEVVATVPVGIRPSAIAAGAGAIWVANLEDRTLSRVAPGARKLVQNIPLHRTPTGLAFGGHAVWVANGYLGTVTRVDPDVNAAVKTIRVSIRSTYGSVAFGEGAVWAAFGIGEVVKIDPATNRHTPPGLFIGQSPSAVAVGAGAVWVANAADNTVSRVNPRTTSQLQAYSVGRLPRAVAVGAAAVWVACQGDNSVWRIDPVSGSGVPIRVGEGPTAVAFGAAAVWVANGGDGTVSRIDPETNEVVETIRVGNRPSGIVVRYGAVWVTVQAPF